MINNLIKLLLQNPSNLRERLLITCKHNLIFLLLYIEHLVNFKAINGKELKVIMLKNKSAEVEGRYDKIRKNEYHNGLKPKH